MIENLTKMKLKNGQLVVGCFVRYPDASLSEFIALLGWDFLVFDGEHGAIGPGHVADLCRAAELRGVTPLVRVPVNEPSLILRVLDAGCHGVHVPGVDSAAEAERAVRAIKYKPRGERGLAATRASDWAIPESLGTYVERANRETLTIVQIESIEAVEAVDDYLNLDGLDVLFIGPTDLAQSMGHTGETSHPDVMAAMTHVAEVVTRSDRTLGIFVSTAEEANQWTDRGARYLATGVEGFLRRGMSEFANEVRGFGLQ